MNICIAGATGFVGKELSRALAAQHWVMGLTRRQVPAQGEQAIPDEPRLSWRSANLFSLLEVERAMQGAEVAVYLVHSMLPSGRLTQGSFADLDVLLADNFARAARSNGVKKIVYLGGLIPESSLSMHLRSRLEVERVLSEQGIPLVTLRAGLVIGPNSSSFRILEYLVGRLPLMLCPIWTTTKCQPVALSDVVKVLEKVVLDESLPEGSYDIGGPDVLSYIEMMADVAKQMGVKRRFLKVPYVSRWLSRLWVSAITGTPRDLVYPLIESLEHDMVARDLRLQTRYNLKPVSFKESLKAAFTAVDSVAKPQSRPAARLAAVTLPSELPKVISVQRLPLPRGQTTAWVAREYAAWLPRFLSPVLGVEVTEDQRLQIRFTPFGSLGPKWSLLELAYSEERSSPTRQLYYITGGFLLGKIDRHARGRLEFRVVPGRPECIAAILNYNPRLPWWIYSLTQARLHDIVMKSFGRYLRRRATGTEGDAEKELAVL